MLCHCGELKGYLIDKDRPHVVLSDDEEEGGEAENDVTIEFGHLVPNLLNEETFYASSVKSWQNALVDKQMGSRRPLRMLALYNRLSHLWPYMHSFTMIDHENGFFFIRFKSNEDVIKVLARATCPNKLPVPNPPEKKNENGGDVGKWLRGEGRRQYQGRWRVGFGSKEGKVFNGAKSSGFGITSQRDR
ncbi:OLC1v1004978C1 [Oldenlandia corymbosa var. corymbosa]|uniref:OLC1v1004978C1 n=1 Tax=Oldenlandia corymbosa var. corymbosa TaxID=529605 RepID=A0AAV1DDL1_OLDCO|nr:OLC1v1004978C1 [Oldenlandia corymbosa var. corymbosa]